MNLTPALLKDLIKRKPFKPIRLHLTDGDTVDIRFPQLTLVTDFQISVGWKHPNEKKMIGCDGVFLGWPAIKSYEVLDEPAAVMEGK